ncbi:hypothetical protein G7Y89_g13731 [Cudoniella acicularis]|uniref:Uncharacterized protein n=1 Tax=Cudoniella acicularis TaxID=354080 RepID=A0A8H4R6W3_9HELO|nr:hypothetical protein G7Y89_g13731 [Cudoniella acicularis]
MPSVGLVSAVCGYEGILMRWLFGQNFVLSNGYSIVEYPQGIEKVALEMVEQTWAPDEPKTKFEHKIGPLRGKMREGIGGEKRTLRMVDAEIVKVGG